VAQGDLGPSVPGPKMGWGWVQTQRDLGLGTSLSGPNMGWGLTSWPDPMGLGAGSISKPKRVWVWVIPSPDPKGFGLRSASEPKMGLDPSLSGSNMGWGLTPWPDPIGLGAGCMSGPKGVGFGFESFRVQTQYGLGWGVGLDPRGFGSFPVRTPNGLG
jgi:hypothetical protein